MAPVLTVALVGWAAGAAGLAAPAYQRLAPITANLSAPTAVAVDGAGSRYVVEASTGAVRVYDAAGTYLRGREGLGTPVSVAVDDSGRVYVGNRATGSVAVYGADLTLQLQLGAGAGEFVQPGGIALDAAGTSYVVDSGRESVRVYSAAGGYQYSIGGPGTVDGTFNFPTGIALDRGAGEVLVADLHLVSTAFGPTAGARVQAFSLAGTFRRGFVVFGEGPGKVMRPLGVAVDAAQRVYVTDAYQNVVALYSGAGEFLKAIYDAGSPLRTPLGVAVDGGGRVVVASLQTGRVEVYGVVAGVNCETVSVAAGGDDGYVRSNWSVSWPPTSAGTALSSGSPVTAPAHLFQSGQYRLLVGLVRFETGAVVPDGAAIWSAQLQLYVSNFLGARTLTAEYYPASNWPIDVTDWTNTPASSAHAGTGLSTLIRNQYNSFALQNVSTISSTGPTGLRLHLGETTAPASEASVTWVAQEGGTNAPRLEVCFGAGAPTPTLGPSATPTLAPTVTRTPTVLVPTPTPTPSVPGPTLTYTAVPPPTNTGTPTRTPTPASTPTPTSTGLTCLTLTPAAGSDDGLVRSSWTTTWPPPAGTGAITNATTVAAPEHLYQSGQYRLVVGLVRFDTAAVLPPGAAVWSATLNLYVRDYLGPATVVAEYYAASNWPIDVTDWTSTPAATAHAGTPVTALTRNQYNAFALQNLGSIVGGTATGLRLHFAETTAPASTRSLTWEAQESGTNPPRLALCYAVGPPPAVTATSTAAPSATPTPALPPTLTPTPSVPGPTATPSATAAVATPTATATATPPSSSVTPTATATPTAAGLTCVTMTPVANADDGLVRSGWTASWPPPAGTSAVTSATTVAAPEHLYQTGQYRLVVGLLRFDTGAVLPDGAAVQSATLQLYVRDYLGARTVAAEYYAASNWPIDVTDWTSTAANTAHAGTAVTALARNQYNSFALQNLSNISTTALTGLRLHFAESAAPATSASLTWTARDAGTAAPTLEVCY